MSIQVLYCVDFLTIIACGLVPCSVMVSHDAKGAIVSHEGADTKDTSHYGNNKRQVLRTNHRMHFANWKRYQVYRGEEGRHVEELDAC